jgi:hypothetical protein
MDSVCDVRVIYLFRNSFWIRKGCFRPKFGI